MKWFRSSAIFTSCAAAMALGALSGVLPACGQFGYGPLADSIDHTIRSARDGGSEESSEPGPVSTSDLALLDQLYLACSPEPVVHKYSPSMYARVVEVAARSIGPESRPARLEAAHRTALNGARRSVIDCLIASQQYGMLSWYLREWRTRVGRHGSYAPGALEISPEVDLENAVATIQATPDMTRGSALLRIYFRHLVRALDPFAHFSDEALDGGPMLPPREGEFADASVTVAEGVLRIALRDWDSEERVRLVVEELVSRADSSASSEEPWSSVLVDLRLAAGLSDSRLTEFRRAFEPYLRAEAPIVVLIDGATRGTPELWAASVAGSPSVALIGQPSAGYAKTFCEETAAGQLKLSVACGDLPLPEPHASRPIPVQPDIVNRVSDRAARIEYSESLLKRGISLPYVRRAPGSGEVSPRLQQFTTLVRELELEGSDHFFGHLDETARAWGRVVRGETPAVPEHPAE